jgi:replicative DNA helicase
MSAGDVDPIVETTYNMEKCYLASLFIEAKDQVLNAVSEQCFFREGHKFIYAAIAGLINSGRAVDFVTVENALIHGKDSKGIAKNLLEEIGGGDYLFDCLEYVPSSANWQTYAQAVTENAQKRAYAEKCRKVIQMVREGYSLDEVRAVDENFPKYATVGSAPLYRLGDSPIGEDEDEDGVTTGFPSLDAFMTTGGYPNGQFTVVSAYHKGGKTSFMLSSFAQLLQADKRVLFATFADMNRQRLEKRLMRSITGWSKRPDHHMMGKLEFDQTFNDMQICWNGWIYDATKMDTGYDVETFCRWLEMAHVKLKFDVVFIDYAQKLTSSDKKAVTELTEANICSKKLARCFERTGIAGVIGSQITEGRDGGRDMTKGSRKWEEDAGWVLRIRKDTDSTKMVQIPFSRFGFDDKEVLMTWNVERLRFEDRSL